MGSRCRSAVLVFLGIVVGVACASAQNNRFTERSFVPSPSVRATGDAGVALPGRDRPFFYNPAQLPHISSYFSVVGVQASASHNMRDQIKFFNRRLQPAIEDNFDWNSEALRALYREAFRIGRRPVRGTGAIVLPAFVYSANGVGIGGGLFAKTALNYRINDAGLGVPEVYLLSRTDIMGVLALGMDLGTIGLPGLSVGGTLTRERRFLTFENKPLDTFTSSESAVLLLGKTLQVDVGGLYTPPWWGLPGRLRLGGAVYDVLDRPYEYGVGDSPRIPFLKGLFAGAPDSTSGSREAERARRLFQLKPSYRVGVAYQVASLFGLNEVGVAVDHQGYGHGRQHVLARLHAGIRAEMWDGLVLRAGLSGGYPTGGIGLRLGAFQFDYALHAFENGRVPGQIGTYGHTARLMLRIQ